MLIFFCNLRYWKYIYINDLNRSNVIDAILVKPVNFAQFLTVKTYRIKLNVPLFLSLLIRYIAHFQDF